MAENSFYRQNRQSHFSLISPFIRNWESAGALGRRGVTKKWTPVPSGWCTESARMREFDSRSGNTHKFAGGKSKGPVPKSRNFRRRTPGYRRISQHHVFYRTKTPDLSLATPSQRRGELYRRGNFGKDHKGYAMPLGQRRREVYQRANFRKTLPQKGGCFKGYCATCRRPLVCFDFSNGELP